MSSAPSSASSSAASSASSSAARALSHLAAYAVPAWMIAVAAAAVAVVFVIWRARRALARAAAADADFGGVYELDPDFAKLVADAPDAPPALLAIGPLGAGRAAVILDASAAEPAEGRLAFEPESSVGRLARAYKISAAGAPLGRARVTGGGLPARVSCELRDRGRLLLVYVDAGKQKDRRAAKPALYAMYVRNCVVSAAFA